jgi:hypothetical protein
MLANPSRPVQELHDGQRVTGWLEAYRRDDEGWRGMVRYSPDPAPGTCSGDQPTSSAHANPRIAEHDPLQLKGWVGGGVGLVWCVAAP